MKKLNYSILICCPVKHIKGFQEKLRTFSKYKILENPSKREVSSIIHKYDIIYTNPNKLRFVFDKELIEKSKKLKIFCTASTGTAHVDKKILNKKKIKFFSLTKDYSFLKKITATAELAFGLTLSHLRYIPNSFNQVKNFEWNYLSFVGQQFNQLNVGIIGYGRLGKIYSKYCIAFGAKLFVYDPYKKIKNRKIKQVNSLKFILNKCDVVALHVHLNKKTKFLINRENLKFAKKNLILINTSRGEVVNDDDLLNFLKKNLNARYGTDVLSNEYTNSIKSNKLIKHSKTTNQIIITPHIGGMTKFSQENAFLRSLEKVIKHLNQ